MTSTIVVLIIGLVVIIPLAFAARNKYRASRPRATRPTPSTTTTPAEAETAQPSWWRRNWWWTSWIIVSIGIILVLIILYNLTASTTGPGSSPVVSSYDQSATSRLTFETLDQYISGCESGNGTPGSGRQKDDRGNVITRKNSNGSEDRGMYGINSVHDAEIAERKIDIMTEEGNRKFAVILYERNGLRDWEASRPCWGPQLLALGYSTSTTAGTGIMVLVLTQEKPRATVVVSPGHRWDLAEGNPLSGWTTGSGFRDERGNRIQIFEVTPAGTEVTLRIAVTKCPTPQRCAW